MCSPSWISTKKSSSWNSQQNALWLAFVSKPSGPGFKKKSKQGGFFHSPWHTNIILEGIVLPHFVFWIFTVFCFAMILIQVWAVTEGMVHSATWFFKKEAWKSLFFRTWNMDVFLLRGSWKGMIWIWVVWKCLSSICSLRSAKKIQNTLLPWLLSCMFTHAAKVLLNKNMGSMTYGIMLLGKRSVCTFVNDCGYLFFKDATMLNIRGLYAIKTTGLSFSGKGFPLGNLSVWCFPFSGHQVAYGWKKSSRHGACRGTHGRRTGSGKHSGSKTDAMLTTGVVKIAIVQPCVGSERGKLLGAPQKISS